MVRVAVVPGGGLHSRSARAVWNAAPCPATSAMVTTPAAYFQQAALQLAGVSQAPAIPYSPYTVPAAPAIVYAVPAAPAVAYAVPAAPAIVWSSTIFFGPPRAINPKRPAPAAPTAAPPAKSIKPYSSPYAVFCQEQRPFLPRNLRNSAFSQFWLSGDFTAPEHVPQAARGSGQPRGQTAAWAGLVPCFRQRTIPL